MTSPASKQRGFDYANADIILVSAVRQHNDNTEPRQFKVHKNILSVASPVFETMLSLPQPDPTHIQTVECSETEETLDLLLRYIYPIPDPNLNLEQIADLFAAAVKYEIEATILSLRKLLVLPDLLNNRPIGVYGIASRYGFEPELGIALKATLYKGVTGVLEQNIGDLALLPSAYSFCTLIEYHQLFFKTVSQNYSRIIQDQRSLSCRSCESLPIVTAVLDRHMLRNNLVFKNPEQLVCALDDEIDRMFPCGHNSKGSMMSQGYERLRNQLKSEIEAFNGTSFTINLILGHVHMEVAPYAKDMII